MKLAKATEYSARIKFVVSTTRLKPTIKKIVGGNASRTSCKNQPPTRRPSPAGVPVGSAGMASSV
jgi:hypothetical protein